MSSMLKLFPPGPAECPARRDAAATPSRTLWLIGSHPAEIEYYPPGAWERLAEPRPAAQANPDGSRVRLRMVE